MKKKLNLLTQKRGNYFQLTIPYIAKLIVHLKLSNVQKSVN
jgi:hypothetical protein